MSENKRDYAEQFASLPELEIRCRNCGGRGSSSYEKCPLCAGSGFELTPFGEKVFRLMRHRFRELFNGE